MADHPTSSLHQPAATAGTVQQPSASPPTAVKKTATPGGEFHSYPWWAPRFWHGMTFGVWLRLLRRNRFRISPTRWPLAFGVTSVSLFNSVLAFVQRLLLGGRVARSTIAHPPIFVLGHWRSGTTYLHELLVLDDRFSYPTTYECMSPSHFLISDWFITRFMKFLLPSKRPMDNMSAGWNVPQEDEFALCNLGLGSPYTTMAFPNHPPQDQEFLDLRGVSPDALSRWKEGMMRFILHLAYKKPDKPLVLKSPPHTARVKTLLELFPNSYFVHIVRNPLSVFPSNVRLWRSLYEVNGLQVDDKHDMTEYVLNTFNQMYRSFEEESPLIARDKFFEVRYEDLVKDPIGRLRNMYTHFGFENFEAVVPKLQAFMSDKKDYQTNRFEMSAETRAMIMDRLGDFARKYGYAEAKFE